MAKRRQERPEQVKGKREERAAEPKPEARVEPKPQVKAGPKPKPEPKPQAKAEPKPEPEPKPQVASADVPRPRPRRPKSTRAWHRTASTLPSVANVLRAAGLACWASAVIVPALVLAFGEESRSAGDFLVETIVVVGGLAILGALCLGAGEALVCLRALVRDMRQVREALAFQDEEEAP